MSVIEVSDSTFDELVLASDKPVLVDFWAPWCGPCKRIAPILEQLAEERGEKITVVKLNVDENPVVSNRYEVMSIPTLKVFSFGVPVKTMVGVRPMQELVLDLAEFI